MRTAELAPSQEPSDTPAAPKTQWAPLAGILAFVFVASAVMGFIGWKKRD